jgi:hypothetical protein
VRLVEGYEERKRQSGIEAKTPYGDAFKSVKVA